MRTRALPPRGAPESATGHPYGERAVNVVRAPSRPANMWMMTIVCPYSFGFRQGLVVTGTAEIAAVESEDVTEVGTARAALWRLLDHAARFDGLQERLP